MTKHPKTLYDFSFNALGTGEEMPLSQFKGKVVMVVNTASKCGFTGQYEALEKLYTQYKDQGLVIIGVPTNDFRGQEPGTNEEIASFCQINYGVTFPMTQKEIVTGPNRHPFFEWANQVNGWASAPRWNFHKYLFTRDGQPATYYFPLTPPDSPRVVRKIKELLRV